MNYHNYCIVCRRPEVFCVCNERPTSFAHHCLRCGYSYPTGSNCKCKIPSRSNKVTKVNKIDAFQVAGIKNIQKGDILIHHSGRKYFVNSVSNLDDTDKFPKTITYVEFGVMDGAEYSRPERELVRTMFNSSYCGDRVNA